jgi:hypothetical protein
MGLPSIFNLVSKFLIPSSQGATTVQRTEAEAEQKPLTSIDRGNAAVTRETNQQEDLNLKQQLHATVEPDPAKAVVVSGNQEIPNQELLAMAQERAKKDPAFNVALTKASIPDGIEVKISKDTIQKVLTFAEPFLPDFKGNLDRFLSKPFDKPTTGIELMEKFFSIPLARKILDATGNYMGELSSKAAVLHPEQTQAATVPTPA